MLAAIEGSSEYHFVYVQVGGATLMETSETETDDLPVTARWRMMFPTYRAKSVANRGKRHLIGGPKVTLAGDGVVGTET